MNHSQKILLTFIIVLFSTQLNAFNHDKDHENFFKQFKNSEMLSPALKIAIENHKEPKGQAADIGAGTGRDTIHLLRRGLNVIAIDPAKTAVQTLNQRFGKKFAKKLKVKKGTIENLALPPQLDIVNLSWTSRFLDPDRFNHTFGKITKSLKVGGRFAGDFCGEKWGHKGKKRKGLFHTYKDIMGLFSQNYKIEYFKEKLRVHEDGFTEHLYEVVARKVN